MASPSLLCHVVEKSSKLSCSLWQGFSCSLHSRGRGSLSPSQTFAPSFGIKMRSLEKELMPDLLSAQPGVPEGGYAPHSLLWLLHHFPCTLLLSPAELFSIYHPLWVFRAAQYLRISVLHFSGSHLFIFTLFLVSAVRVFLSASSQPTSSVSPNPVKLQQFIGAVCIFVLQQTCYRW